MVTEEEFVKLSCEEWEALRPWEKQYKLDYLRRKTQLLKESTRELTLMWVRNVLDEELRS